jgi:hypothetical protein
VKAKTRQPVWRAMVETAWNAHIIRCIRNERRHAPEWLSDFVSGYLSGFPPCCVIAFVCRRFTGRTYCKGVTPESHILPTGFGWQGYWPCGVFHHPDGLEAVPHEWCGGIYELRQP